MAWQFTLIIFSIAFTTILAIILAYYSWQRRNLGKWVFPFILLMLAICVWSLGYGMELASPDLPSKIFWAKIQYIGIVLTPLAWVSFALLYSGWANWLKWRQMLFLAIIPLFTLLLVFTNEHHQLIWQSVELVTSGPFILFDAGYGGWFWIHTAYSYLLTVLGSIILFRAFRYFAAPFRLQFWILSLAPFLPLFSNILFLAELSLLPKVDLTPSAFMISGCVIAWGVFRLNLFDIVPVARQIAVENMRDGVIVIDQQNRLIDINPSAEEMMRSLGQDLIGQTLDQLLAHRPDLLKKWGLISRELGESSQELQVNGHCYDIYNSVVRDNQQKERGRLIIFRDVTEHKHVLRALQQAREDLEKKVLKRTAEIKRKNESLQEQIEQRKQAEQALRESESKFRTLTETTSAAIFIFQGNKNRYVNPAAEAVTGYSREELLRMNFWDIIDLDLQQKIKKQEFIRQRREPFPHLQELKIFTKNGNTRWLTVRFGFVEYEGATAVLGTAFDFTEHKQAEEQIIKSERLAALGRMAAALSHEINNPLQIIQTCLDLSLDFEIDPVEQEEYLNAIRQQINLLKETNQRILNYASARPAPRQPVSISDLLDHIIILLQKQISQSGARLDIDLKPIPSIMAVPEQLTQVFLNLLLNAVESVPPNGLIQINVRSETEYLEVTIQNNGAPIPVDVLPHIFEPFYTTKAEGYGLGLWISHRVIRQHGGRLKVENLNNRQGVRFTVTLPIEPVLEKER